MSHWQIYAWRRRLLVRQRFLPGVRLPAFRLPCFISDVPMNNNRLYRVIQVLN